MTADATIFDEADLNAFTDGRLEPVRAAALAESLACDRLSRARIDSWKRQNEGLRTLFASVLFEPVPIRLLPTTLTAAGAARAAEVPIEASVARGGSFGTATALTAIGVAFVGFLAGAIVTIATDGAGRIAWGARGAESRPVVEVSTLAERAAETYRAALADPGRTSEFLVGDEARLQHWMIRQLPGAARIPDLRSLGWKLLGGRVVPGHYAPAAFLTYRLGAERLGLYISRDPLPSALRIVSFADDGLTVGAWSDDGLGIALASTRASDGAMDSVRDAVRRQISGNTVTP